MSSATHWTLDYPGTSVMMSHDGQDALRRWFHNYKLDKEVYGPSREQWLSIEERAWHTRRGKRCHAYVGIIGSDYSQSAREVRFEANAPPPPTFYAPAVERYEPPQRPMTLPGDDETAQWKQALDKIQSCLHGIDLARGADYSALFVVPPTVLRQPPNWSDLEMRVMAQEIERDMRRAAMMHVFSYGSPPRLTPTGRIPVPPDRQKFLPKGMLEALRMETSEPPKYRSN